MRETLIVLFWSAVLGLGFGAATGLLGCSVLRPPSAATPPAHGAWHGCGDCGEYLTIT